MESPWRAEGSWVSLATERLEKATLKMLFYHAGTKAGTEVAHGTGVTARLYFLLLDVVGVGHDAAEEVAEEAEEEVEAPAAEEAEEAPAAE